MELKESDTQKLVIELSREEFRTVARMCDFVNNAFDLVDRDVMPVNIPRHKVDEVVRGVAGISARVGVK